VVVNNGLGVNTVSVLLGIGDGTFTTNNGYGAGTNPFAVAIGDFNGDTRPDVAVANDIPSPPGTVSVLMNIGRGWAGVPFVTNDRPLFARISPNPASGPVSFQFAMPRAGRISLAIYDVAGRLVRTPLDQGIASGTHSLLWDGRDRHGALVPAGAYYVAMRVNGQQLARKLVILR
jgi:hypothetical protein